MKLTRDVFLKNNDHSLLKPTLTMTDLREGLEFAAEVGCGAVCISPHRLDLAREILAGTDVHIATVIGFPTGCHATEAKVAEAKIAYEQGAVELDMVMDIGAMLSGEEAKVHDDIAAVVQATPGAVKVIFEVAYLSNEQIVRATEIASDAGVAFVKTATGFVPGGATPENIALMKGAAGPGVKVKASGGLSNLADVQAVYEAGAQRWGISRTKQILAEF
ncbi:deoxyribose-phosphate aldolase [Propionicicella superfundia]|uniref:deoxyribose-phosphate aldolase n=1 Tax=Propionicicella superfundia TaxID=348582 RepID=UPI0003FFF0D7|nr:deoxyribose-phosphate aldolase [Propionicicella superfundia]